MTHSDWKPSATFKQLQFRAELYKNVRAYFAALGVLEIETPLLINHPVIDSHIAPFKIADKQGRHRYLHTSPEYAMKRLLAAGSGSIYQICKVFREEEEGKFHNPEFTMLEWYRVGIDYHELMHEISDLLQACGIQAQPSYISYQKIFEQHFKANPHTINTTGLATLCEQHIKCFKDISLTSHTEHLDLLFSYVIQPNLGIEHPIFVYDFPRQQCALAKTGPNITDGNNAYKQNNYTISQRFELFWKGIELANGYQELTDPVELQRRLTNEAQTRSLATSEIDPFLLQAQQHGLPECAGVAVGLDRLLMSIQNFQDISEVISFTTPRA